MIRTTLGIAIITAAITLAGARWAYGQTVIIDPVPMPPVPDPARIVPPPPPPRPIPPRPIPRPRPRPPRPQRDMQLQVKKHHVEVSIVDGVAVTNLDQVFFNPHHFTVEGTYIFPLPDDVGLSKFTMFVNGREIEGKLLEVDEARRIYESIVARMRDPALLEYLGTKMFRARIFPINPKSDVRVRLSYTQMLEADAGLVHYRYPLNTEKHLASPVGTVTASGSMPGPASAADRRMTLRKGRSSSPDPSARSPRTIGTS